MAGDERVQGRTFVQRMGELGYRFIYSAARPKIAHMLLADDALDRLYLTQVCRILGGAPFSSIVEGPLLKEEVNLPLLSLYYDPSVFHGAGQLFGCYGRDKAVVI